MAYGKSNGHLTDDDDVKLKGQTKLVS